MHQARSIQPRRQSKGNKALRRKTNVANKRTITKILLRRRRWRKGSVVFAAVFGDVVNRLDQAPKEFPQEGLLFLNVRLSLANLIELLIYVRLNLSETALNSQISERRRGLLRKGLLVLNGWRLRLFRLQFCRALLAKMHNRRRRKDVA